MEQTDTNFETTISELPSSSSSSPTAQTEQRLGFIYALIAVGLFASSAVLVVKAEPVGPLEKAFGRIVIATLFVYSLSKFTPGGQTPTGIRRRDLPRLALYGLVAALHFGLYVAALNFTTAAHTLTIVYTSPVFVTIGSAIFLNETIKPRKWIGIGVVGVGVAILAGFEPNLTGRMLIGDLMALGAALAYSFYSIAGRRERHRFSLLGYTLAVYGFAAIWLFVPAFISFTTGPGLSAYSLVPILAIIALGVGPLGSGHTLYNAALRRIHATYANVIATQEVTFGVALAWLFLDQPLGLTTFVGMAVALVGTLMVLL